MFFKLTGPAKTIAAAAEEFRATARVDPGRQIALSGRRPLMADLIVLLHFAFVVFVVLGGLLALRWPRVVWLHVPAVIWGALVEFTGWICPLTPLENRLRRASGEASYQGDFIAHYILPALYPERPDPTAISSCSAAWRSPSTSPFTRSLSRPSSPIGSQRHMIGHQ